VTGRKAIVTGDSKPYEEIASVVLFLAGERLLT